MRDPEDKPGFAFKLHQFFAQPGSKLYSVALDDGADANAHGILMLNTNTGELRYLGLEHAS